jgi:hypothetical protein
MPQTTLHLEALSADVDYLRAKYTSSNEDDKVENLQRYAEAQFKLYEALLEWTRFKNPQDIERRDFWKAVSTP